MTTQDASRAAQALDAVRRYLDAAGVPLNVQRQAAQRFVDPLVREVVDYGNRRARVRVLAEAFLRRLPPGT